MKTIKSPREFERVFSCGKRAYGSLICIRVAKTCEGDEARVLQHQKDQEMPQLETDVSEYYEKLLVQKVYLWKDTVLFFLQRLKPIMHPYRMSRVSYKGYSEKLVSYERIEKNFFSRSLLFKSNSLLPTKHISFVSGTLYLYANLFRICSSGDTKIRCWKRKQTCY